MSIVIQGIDVSKYQGIVDWAKVKAAGIGFVMVRVGWCGYNGKIAANNGLDPTFVTNVEGALAAGLDVGVYVFSYATTSAAARVAARETLALVDGYRLTYPIAFDMEDTSSGTGYNANSRTDNNTIATAFLDEVAQGGYTPILYTYKSFAESYLDMPALSDYDFWLAEYHDAVSYGGDYTIWQYTSTGRVDGISGEVDRNLSYKDYSALYGQNEQGNENEGSGGEENEENDDNNSSNGSEENPAADKKGFFALLRERLTQFFR